MLNAYIIAAAISMSVVVISYAINFFAVLGYGISSDSAVWGQFGDYIGGLLNPVLSFISLILLIKSLALQNEANQDLRKELRNNEKAERLKSFSGLFFNMIDSQKSLLENFTVSDDVLKAAGHKRGVSAIMALEDEIERRREGGASDQVVSDFLAQVDSDDQVFGILRAFYITVKMISERLDESRGFDYKDRKDHLLTLVNFTDFSQLRLVIMGIQFENYPAAVYLRNNQELCAVLEEVGLKLDPY